MLLVYHIYLQFFDLNKMIQR